MIAISGYRVGETIYESGNTLVYRGIREMDNQPVVLKVLKEAYAQPETIAWFKREYEITRALNLPGVVTVYGLETHQERWVMVLEDFGGESLVRLGKVGALSLVEFLTLGIQVADIMGQVHQQNIVHKDIKPSHILLNPTTGQVKITDFGGSTVLTQESLTIPTQNAFGGTLAYMSPEQTGRMHRAVDYRTDFYSLGVTFYQLLVGQLPFPSTDPMELVHCHIAKQPQPPHKLRHDMPRVVSDLLMKLLAKNADDRYQSAYGLKADLEQCLRQLEATGHLAAFPLGRQDVP
ncbi:MAG TPA: serine/threonine-protein kinase, partial [Anaerolineae bacterium]|nr:serine/threonine-protein kinase [Anaerolineae bacterium]